MSWSPAGACCSMLHSTTARPVNNHGPVGRSAPPQAAEAVTGPCAQLATGLSLVCGQHADPQPGDLGQQGPRGRRFGHADEHHGRVQGNGRERAHGNALWFVTNQGGQRRDPCREGAEHMAKSDRLQRLSQGHQASEFGLIRFEVYQLNAVRRRRRVQPALRTASPAR